MVLNLSVVEIKDNKHDRLHVVHWLLDIFVIAKLLSRVTLILYLQPRTMLSTNLPALIQAMSHRRNYNRMFFLTPSATFGCF